jgi:hypoxanthine phosphoribosyltransferase
MKPASLKYAIIFHKKNPKNLEYNFYADYIGFLIPDVFVFGYGMDYNELFREMSHLCVISQKGVEAFKDA